MDKQQAQRHIQAVLGSPFNRENFEDFARNLLNKIEPRDNHYRGGSLWEAYREHITQYWRIGKYTDPNGDALDILIIETKNLAKLDRARTSLRNFVVRHLKEFNKDYALAAFYSKEDHGADWRFSFIKVEPEAYQDEKGKVKTRSLLSPAKRYSFLVGEHENFHTAKEQLSPLLEMDYADPTLAQIESAFSVEKVTDEFFQQYKDLYLKLFEHLSQSESVTAVFDEAATIRFTKKLLGQIVFLYFLQKKGWLGVPQGEAWGKGNRRFLRDLFQNAVDRGQNFYTESLQFLFYEALAHERKNTVDPAYYPRFDCKIPFLNGGLFEADYDWVNVQLIIPNELFSNQEKNKAGDTGTGILDIFDRYNFTIKEDEPLEKEVAVDPEMLGKVFENMLEIAERKSKGAFYTPREIVHYMCQESLIHYLDNALNGNADTYREFGSSQTSFIGNENRTGQLNFTEEEPAIRVPREDLETLIRHGYRMLENDQRVLDKGKETDTYYFQLPASVRTYAVLLDEKLATIKICDPAIGSGAFPVGLLHEVVNARAILQPFTGASQSVYGLKRHAIQASIYGVDIDASAIDIARLRLWLSLIVDEDDYATIDALPNLDYKIVKGNSLIGFPENWNSPRTQEIEALKDRFFAETEHQQQERLKAEIDTKINQHLANAEKVFGYKIEFDFRLLFSEVWRTKGGFDIVIGNPPYVQIQKSSGTQDQKDWEKQEYKVFAKTGDIYALFYEKGGRILRPGGALTFITSNKWMRTSYGEKLREYFLNDVSIHQLIDFGDSQIFKGATTYTNILVFSKTKQAIVPKVWDVSESFQTNVPLKAMLPEENMAAYSFTADGFVILSQKLALIKKRVEAVGTPLKEWDITICRGILTGFNEAFIIDGKTKDELIAQDPKSAEIIKPILRGRDIKRYQATFADLWLIDTHNGYGNTRPIDIAKYPAIKAHLDQYWEGLKVRQDKGVTPYNLRNCAYHHEFEKEKILWLEMSPSANFTYDKENVFALNTAYILTGKCLKYLLAVLNSNVLNSYFPLISTDVQGKTRRYIKQYVENLPIPKIPSERQYPFEILVDYAILTKKSNIKLQSAYFEQLIDGMVYELYFPNEIKAAKKEILAHLGNLTPITDDMRDEAKLAIIQSEFDRLYDPSHPVRNHLETLDSVEEVRIIQAALK